MCSSMRSRFALSLVLALCCGPASAGFVNLETLVDTPTDLHLRGQFIGIEMPWHFDFESDNWDVECRAVAFSFGGEPFEWRMRPEHAHDPLAERGDIRFLMIANIAGPELSEVNLGSDFYQLRVVSTGFQSFDWELTGHHVPEPTGAALGWIAVLGGAMFSCRTSRARHRHR